MSINNFKEAERFGFSIVMFNHKIECIKVLSYVLGVIPILFLPFFFLLLWLLFHVYF
jgi:hypothetical protein